MQVMKCYFKLIIFFNCGHLEMPTTVKVLRIVFCNAIEKEIDQINTENLSIL